jgi:hypothetical protein
MVCVVLNVTVTEREAETSTLVDADELKLDEPLVDAVTLSVGDSVVL